METVRTVCAGGVVLNSEGNVALTMSGPRSDAFWGFPKGHVDVGEDLETAARREIEEETGLTQLELVTTLPIYERYRGTKDGGDDMSELKEIHMFLFQTKETVLAPKDEWNPEARWVKPEEVAALITHPKDRAWWNEVKETVTNLNKRTKEVC